MPISSPLLTYGSEANFRDGFVMPLLIRLGFGVVANYLGQREFGRDVIFGDIDRFGHVVYYGLQLKYEPSVSLSASHELVQDAEQATNNPFLHPSSGRQEYISCFYVGNAGDFSDAARSNFFSIVSRRGIRDARLLDGNALMLLDRSASLRRDAHIRERLMGMLREVARNRNVASELNAKLLTFAHDPENRPYPMQRCRHNASGAYLEAPFVIAGLEVHTVDQYWETSRMINDIADSVGVPMVAGEFRKHRATALAEVVARLDALGTQIQSASRALLAQIGASAA